jgi:hypothetical protein
VGCCLVVTGCQLVLDCRVGTTGGRGVQVCGCMCNTAAGGRGVGEGGVGRGKGGVGVGSGEGSGGGGPSGVLKSGEPEWATA